MSVSFRGVVIGLFGLFIILLSSSTQSMAPIGYECENTTVTSSSGEVFRNTVCWAKFGGTGWSPPTHAPDIEGGSGGGGAYDSRGIKRYTGSTADPEGDGMMNCFKNLAATSNDNYDMDSGDIFSESRTHPVTGVPQPHRGIDIQSPIGTPVHAAAFGFVSDKGENDFNGNFVRIKWRKGSSVFEGTYIHLDSIDVTKSQVVYPGTSVGKSGNTGNSTGPHLHFQVKEIKPVMEINPITKKPEKVGEEVIYKDPIQLLGGLGCSKL